MARGSDYLNFVSRIKGVSGFESSSILKAIVADLEEGSLYSAKATAHDHSDKLRDRHLRFVTEEIHSFTVADFNEATAIKGKL